MKKEKRFKLKRELGLFEATLAGIGIILGAGIYALIGEAAELAGNAIWISFLLSALLAAFTGLSYAELSSMFPRAGAEYVYTEKSFGKRLAFLVGWLVIFAGVIGGATVALGFSGYFGSIFNTPLIPTAFAIILILSLIIFYGIKQSVWFAVIFTLIETGGLLLIIFIGLPYFGSINYLEMPSFNGIFVAAALIFFAFIGFEEMTRLSEETKTPTKVIPKALILAIIITTIIYMLVAISAVSILDWRTLGSSKAPLADVASKALGGGAFLVMSLIALFSTSNTVLLMLLAASRIVYGMSEDSLPKIFGRIHNKTKTPWVAIILVMVLAMIATLPSDIAFVADLTNFTIFITFIVVNFAVVWLRYSMPKYPRPFKTPINIGKMPVLSVFGVFSSAVMLISLGSIIIFYGLLLVLAGLVAYEILKKAGRV